MWHREVVSGRLTAALIAVAVLGGAGAYLLLRADQESARPPPVGSLLRPDTVVTIARTADLDGDGVEEVVVASRSTRFAHFQLPAQYLDVFARRGDSWRRILDGTLEAPPGVGAPDRMLDTPGPDFVSRLVDSVRVVDLADDRAPEVAVGILTAGAGVGPLELWILSMSAGDLRTEYFVRTTRGGEVTLEGDRLVLEFPVYRPQDPGCCPSRIERQVIGYDQATGSIGLLDRSRRRVNP